MTVEVKITNRDATRTVQVVKQHHETPLRRGSQLRAEERTNLGPGESRSFHVHAAMSLLVAEDPEVSRPKPAEFGGLGEPPTSGG